MLECSKASDAKFGIAQACSPCFPARSPIAWAPVADQEIEDNLGKIIKC